MKLPFFILLILSVCALIWLTGCVYSGPKIALHVGFMGAEVGAEIGGAPVIALPPPASLQK